jgi:hypothetical protein
MNKLLTKGRPIFGWAVLSVAVAVTAMGCASAGATPTVAPLAPTVSLGTSPTPAPSPASVATPSPASQEPDTGPAAGDVPDNAVFLTYKDTAHGFSIQYVEGWQVSPVTDGVGIRDKDSNELVQVVAPQTDVTTYVSGTDLPALQGQAGFKLIKQDKVSVNGKNLVHLVYENPSPPDPVTGKQVPSTVDRYYVAGPSGLAIVSLSTPKGVDNVDAFRQMIESFKWV